MVSLFSTIIIIILMISYSVGYQEPGNAITERFVVSSTSPIDYIPDLNCCYVQNAFRGRENPFPDITQDPDFTLATLEASVEREIQEQFNVCIYSAVGRG